MSFLKLLVHSFSIIAVFKFQVFFRSLIFILIFSFLDLILGTNFYLLSILIVIFNILILIVSLREKQKDLLNSQENLEGSEEITH